MRKIILLGLFGLFLNLSVSAQGDFKITLKNGSDAEAQTKTQLERLLKSYDLSKWIMTKTIEIDEKAIPHSHPVLTLSTRHLLDDELLVATFVHEQMHWFVIQDQKNLAAVLDEFKKMFPKVPVGYPEGARDEGSSYLHIAVVYLEYRALRELLGELRAKQVMDFWSSDHYTWIYRTVHEKPREIGQIMFKHKLVPVRRANTNAGADKDSVSANPATSGSNRIFIVLYKTGASWDAAKQPSEQTGFKEHSAHLARLRKEKRIDIGGRYSDTGMLLIRARDEAEARELITSDTAVQNKLFNVEIFPISVFYKGSVE
jgi:hypothetical protein